jgi:hypothetical protein
MTGQNDGPKRRARRTGRKVAQLTVVYWRDIPAQVIVKQGRRAAKRQLPERFEQAIDRCAMKVGARDTDAYLAEWRRGAPVPVEGDLDALAAAEATRLETEFDPERIKALIANGGWAAQD